MQANSSVISPVNKSDVWHRPVVRLEESCRDPQLRKEKLLTWQLFVHKFSLKGKVDRRKKAVKTHFYRSPKVTWGNLWKKLLSSDLNQTFWSRSETRVTGRVARFISSTASENM